MPEFKIEKLLHERDGFSKKQRVLCDYILEHTSAISMMTVSQLAANANVGEATVFRFLKQIGYNNYSDFRLDMHNYFLQYNQSNYGQMRAMLEAGRNARDVNALYAGATKTLALLEKSISADLLGKFDTAVDMMLSATEVGILGLRSSKAMALYFEYILTPYFMRIQQLSHDEHFIYDRVKQFPQGSLLFIITSWPNTNTTIRTAEFCHSLGHRIVLLTNTLSCPIASFADIALITQQSEDHSTIVPFVTVLEALAGEIGARLAPLSIRQLEETDEILQRYDVTNWRAK